MKQAILIYGDPGNGKSYLSQQLKERFKYHIISLDKVYVDFIKTEFSNFYLPELPNVIGQHYVYMFKHDPAREKNWIEHVVTIAKQEIEKNDLIAIEGYLMLPPLKTVQEALSKLANVKVVEVRNQLYFQAATIDELVT